MMVTLAIGDLGATQAAANPFVHILTTGLGPTLGNAMVWMILGAMWFCGLASITSNSRMLFAFSRDGGLPAVSPWLARVSPRFRSPHIAVWVAAAAAFVVALWAEAYSVMVALSTIALYASYGVPIAVGFAARRSGRWSHRGPWDLGRWSEPVNLMALTWIAILTVLFVLPPNVLAGTTFAGCLALLALLWFGWARRHFKGPPLQKRR